MLADPSILQNLKVTLLIHRIKCFPKINEDLVQGRLLEERELLRQLGFHDGGSASHVSSKFMEIVMEFKAL